MDIEIPEIKKTFKTFGENYNPKFAEITVNKRIDDRFFAGKYNPSPGTIVSKGVVSDNFEFFIGQRKLFVQINSELRSFEPNL